MAENENNIPMGIGLSQDPKAQNNINNMSERRLRKVMTQYLQSTQDTEFGIEGEVGQLIDRKASNNFQG